MIWTIRFWLSRFALLGRVVLCLVGFAVLALAQTPFSSSPLRPRSNEWAVTTGGGARIAGSTREDRFWTMQLRWGRVLTAPRGPGLLHGSLEYAFEVVPAFVMAQSGPVESRTIFGGGFNPFLLQYNFGRGDRPERGFVPFFQVGAGALFTTDPIPAGTARFNFTPQGGAGFYWLRGDAPSFVLGLRWHHISNAGRVTPNPGHNALYLYAGLSWWR